VALAFFAGVLNLVVAGWGHTVVYLTYIYFCVHLTVLYCIVLRFHMPGSTVQNATIATFRNPELLLAPHAVFDGWMDATLPFVIISSYYIIPKILGGEGGGDVIET